MFKNLRRSLLALAVVAGSTVAFPVVQQVSAGADGTIDASGWAVASGGLSKIPKSFSEGGATVAFRPVDAEVLSSGKILVAGFVGDYGSLQLAAVRINADGTLDTSFDSNGLKLIGRMGSDASTSAQGMYKVNGGFLITASSGGGSFFNDKPAAVKIDESGDIVTSWGTSGWIVNSRATSGGYPEYFTVTSSDVWSMAFRENQGTRSASVYRFNVDTGAGVNMGMTQDNYMDIPTDDLGIGRFLNSLFPAGPGKIAIVTESNGSNQGVTATIVRFDISGPAPVVDTSFGTNGTLTTSVPVYELPAPVQSNSSWLLFGAERDDVNGHSVVIGKFSFDATLDTSWGNGGYKTLADTDGWSPGNNRPAILSDGRFAYQVERRSAGTWRDAVIKLTDAGDLDASFGTAGVAFASPQCSSTGFVFSTTNGDFFQMGNGYSYDNGQMVENMHTLKWSSGGSDPANCTGEPPTATITPMSATISGTVNTPIVSNAAPALGNWLTPPTFAVGQYSSPLPAGLTLNTSNGVVSGTPTAPSQYVSVDLEASNGIQTASYYLTFNISADQGGGGGGGGGTCSGGASITPSSRTEMGTVGQPMSIPAPTPSGYSTAPTFTLANLSYFPPGLNLSSNGSISGTPTSSASGMTSAITVSNGSQSCTYLVTFNITGNSTPCVAGAPSSTNSAVTFDSSFSSDGVYQLLSQSGSPAPVDAEPGPNGTIVVAAMEGVNYGGGSSNSSSNIYRMLPDGTLDTTWGTAGVANIDINPSTSYFENVQNIHVSPDGSVLVSLQVYISGMASTQEIRVAKLTSAGVLDTNFATNGFATIHSGDNMNTVYPRDMVAGPSGSVYLSAFASGNTSSLKVYKVLGNGSLDSSFATNGILDIGSSGTSITADGVGNLYVGGRTSSTPANASLSRYTTAGAVDTTFGTNGQVEFDISQSTSESLGAITFANGKITGIVRSSTGMGMMPTYSESAVRVDSDGDVDASFGTAGVATLATSSVSTQEIKILSDGSALLSGMSFGMNMEWALSAIGNDGSSVGTLVTSPAKFSSGACTISEGSIAELPSGIFFAGVQYPSGSGGSASGFVFKIALNGVSSGGGSGGGSTPTLVNSSNQSLLERDPGSVGMIINGQSVSIDTTRVEISAARTPAAQRTPAQVAAIQAAGQALLQEFLASLPAGAVTNVAVVNTTTGAVMQNLVFDGDGNSVDVPVEDIVILDGPAISLMIGSNNANITSDGKYQVGAGGIVGVVGAGLGANAPGEIVAMSTPTLLANFTTSANGDLSQSAQLPNSIGVGDHTLVVATGNTFAVMGLRVVPAALPTTGLSDESGRTMVIALFTMVFAAVLVRSRRLTLLAR
ncbi:MAG: putative Ig domain-containing protein [Ilumatobacteraceae bacterium]